MHDDDKLDRIAEDCAATRAHIINLKEYISSVGDNVSELRECLYQHKENTDAHGRKSADGTMNQVISWLSLAVAALLGINEIRKH